MIEHRGEDVGRLRTRRRIEPRDRARDAERAVIDLGGLAFRLGPDQRHRLGEITDEIAAHREELGIDSAFHHDANRGGLHRLEIDHAGQRRHRPAAIGIGRGAQIVRDQFELGMTRSGVDQPVEKLREGAHAARMPLLPGKRKGASLTRKAPRL